MDIHSLQAIVIDALEDIKAQDIKLFDTVPLTSLFDRVAIVSGTSNRQTRALAAHVRDKVKQAGGDVISVEGEETGEWVLVDLGDMVVHVMQPTIRSYYNLEELWGEYPIDYKATKKNMSRRSASVAAPAKAQDDAAPKAPIARKASAKKPAYEKGESTQAKTGKSKSTASQVAKTGSAGTKPAESTVRKAKPETRSDALSDVDFSAIGTAKAPPKTLPWRAAADKPGKLAAKPSEPKSRAKPASKTAANKSPVKKLAAPRATPKTATPKTTASKAAPAKRAAPKK